MEDEHADKRARVLVVDDVEDNRDVLTRRLLRQGLYVSTAVDGRDALNALANKPFDLVLLDIMMPELDGYQVLESMKADPRLKDIPVIVISALDEVDSIVRCIKLGAEDYLTKPFNATILRARVESCLAQKAFRDKEKAYLNRIEDEKQRADQLLRVILPDPIAKELTATGQVEPRRHEDIAVLFVDIVGFTSYCDQREPAEVLAGLQTIVREFEESCEDHHVEKIKTIGDGFMAACGLDSSIDNPVLNCVDAGYDMIRAAHSLSLHWEIRVGIHVGPVVAGIVGDRRFTYDLWGDTVNTAARVEQNGLPSRVNLSATAWQRLDAAYRAESEIEIDIKGKGLMKIVHLESNLMQK